MKRYLALGDSYTIGEGVAAHERWPAQLVQALRASGMEIEEPHIIATTGWATDELASELNLVNPFGHWDLVSLLIGVNDQYRGRTVADYHCEFGAMLKRAIGYAGRHADRVMVLSIPDWGVTPFGQRDARGPAQIAAEIDAYNAAARELCAEHGVAFVDITPITRARSSEPSMLVDDGLHPSRAMYALWVERALPVARALLGR